MKIAYLTCVYPPYPGGIGYQAKGMAEELVKRGHEVHVWTPKVSGVRDQGSGVNVHYVRPWLRFGNAAFLPQLIWQLKSFDIVHLCYPFFGVAELLPLIRRRTRAKIVVHHLMDAEAPGFLGAIFKFHARYFMSLIFRCADRVLVLSDDYYKNSELARLSFPKEKLGVVPNAIDTDLFQPVQVLLTTHYLLPTILLVGGLDRAHYFKGVEVLIRACMILKERGVKFRCQIIGQGSMRKEYERLARGCPEIEFVGLVPHAELPHYYQGVTVVVVPSTSRVECFSIVAAEAQACGVPAIVSDFPGARVTIENGVTGLLVRSGDAEDLAQKLVEIIADREKAKKMGLQGRKRVEQLYSWSVVGDTLEKIYASLYHP